MYVHARGKSSEKYLNSVNNENEECWDRNIGVRASMQVNKNVYTFVGITLVSVMLTPAHKM